MKFFIGIIKVISFLAALTGYLLTIPYRGLMEIDYSVIDYFIICFLFLIVIQVFLFLQDYRKGIVEKGKFYLSLVELLMMIICFLWFKDTKTFYLMFLWLIPMSVRWYLPFFLPERKKRDA